MCPKCGYCDKCGRSNQPSGLYPWPYYPHPWQYYPSWVTYSNGGGHAVPITTTGTTQPVSFGSNVSANMLSQS